MAYGKIYINDLSSKVTALFDELQASKNLNEKAFITAFKEKYPKDYDLLVYEWEFKVHAFKKNKKGHPVPHPIRPEKILSNMFRNYYYKLVTKPKIKKAKENYVLRMKCEIGKYGYKIRDDTEHSGKYILVNKADGNVVSGNMTYGELKEAYRKILKKVSGKEGVK